MRRLVVIAMFATSACGSGPAAEPTTAEPATQTTAAEPSSGGEASSSEEPARDDEFQLHSSDTAEQAHGEHPSQITATATEAAMRLFVVDPETGPIEGIVIKMTAPNGAVYYTGETDSQGYAEVLVPTGQRYEMEYLSLGHRNTTANVTVREGPNQDIRLTMRYRRRRPAPTPQAPEEHFILEGVLFETGSATIERESYPRLDRVVEYMSHHPSTRIRVAGYTDNVGNPRRNLALSESRAQSVREYLVSHGIDGSRVEAVGFGAENPIASNDTEEGRAQNRRIEATEL